MTFRKPFRATPVRLGPYHRAQKRRLGRVLAAQVMGVAVIAGLMVGIFAALHSNGSLSEAGGWGRDVAVSQGWVRRKTPTAGAYYSGCNDARAAGVAPLYAGEPGYRPEMDGDGDGVACEPYRGLR